MQKLSFAIKKDVCILFSAFIIFLIFSLSPTYASYFSEETSIVENIQLILILSSIYFCISPSFTKNDLPLDVKRLFLVISFIFFCLLGREINWGMIFFEISKGSKLEPAERKVVKSLFYMKSIRYIVEFSAAFLTYFFIKQKLYNTVISLIKTSKIYFFDILFLIISASGAFCCEKLYHNIPLEETFETLFYGTMFLVVYKYTNNKDNILNLS